MKTFKSVADLKLAKLRTGQFVETNGYYAEADGGGAKYYVVASQAADEYGDHTLANGNVAVLQIDSTVNVTQFGAHNTIGSDSAQQTQAAIDYCVTKKIKLVAEGDFDYHSLVDFRQCSVDFSTANIQIKHAGIGCLVGGYSNDPSNPYQTFKQFVRQVGTDGYHTPSVRIIGARGQHVDIGFCTYIQLYANTDSSAGGTEYSIAYSTFRFQNVDTLELTTNNSSDGDPIQWINENKFTMSSCRVLLINGTYHHNHNIFTGGTFESATAQIEMQVGRSNYVRDIRNEGTVNIHFFPGVNDCAVTLAMTNSGHQYFNDAATIVNNQGEMCTVQHEYDQLAPLQTVAAFDYQSLKLVGADYNVQDVAGIVISGTDLSAPAWTYFYTSKLIPVTAGNAFFELLMSDVPAGGVRVEVAGYDANKALITPAADQVNFAGVGNKQFSEQDVGINTSKISKFYVLDGACRYIIIKVRAGGVGVAFDSMYLGARVPETETRKALIGCVNTRNNFV